MSVPKKRRTKSSTGNRRSHHALKSTVLVKCEKCLSETIPHTVCDVCGTYKGKKVVEMKIKETVNKTAK